jgi:hypothetical protein
LASTLRWQLGNHYHLEEEVPVGKKPLQIDILLLRKEQGDLPPSVRQVLAGLVERLGELTLLEFKSPSDTLRSGDFRTFLAYAFLYLAQNHPLLEPSKLHLVVLAPRLTRPYQDEMHLLGVTAREEEGGIWRLQGGPVVHPAWVLETEELAGLQHPLLTVFSPQFLRERVPTYALLRQGGYTELMVYMAQQITQFRQRGEEFAMQHLGTEDQLHQVLLDMWNVMTPEEREQVWPVKERLKGVKPEERLEDLSAEDIVQALSPERLQRLRQLLEQAAPREAGSSDPRSP